MMTVLIGAMAANAIAQRLTTAELLKVADDALVTEAKYAHPAIARWLLTAIALRESGGDPNAVGDDGKAMGLFQFHRFAWHDAWSKDPDGYYRRREPSHAFRAAVRWLSWGARRCEKRGLEPTAARLATFHNSGHPRKNITRYGVTVRLLRAKLMRESTKVTKDKPPTRTAPRGRGGGEHERGKSHERSQCRLATR